MRSISRGADSGERVRESFLVVAVLIKMGKESLFQRSRMIAQVGQGLEPTGW